MELILGRPQTEKSIYLQKMALQKAKENIFRPVWYIVPEQYTLQMQRELIQQNKNQGLLNLEVLSFNRLVYRLQNYLATAGRVSLNAAGKSALIYRILENEPGRFPVIAKRRNSPAYIESLSKMLTECFQYRMTAEKLREIAGSLSGELVRDKTLDLAELLEAYKELLHSDYFVVEAALEHVCQVLKQDFDLSEIEIFVDGFYGFVPIQIEILSVFMQKAKDVHIAFPYAWKKKTHLDLENLRYPSELYYGIKNSISKLRQNSPVVEEKITLIESRRENVSPEMIKIEDELYQSPKEPLSVVAENIFLAEAGNIEEELRYVAEEILSYVHEKGYRYHEMAVLTGNLSTYAAKVDKIFREYELSYFIDQKESIKKHPLPAFIRSALQSVLSGFRYVDLMQHLKNIYAVADEDDPKIRAELDRLDIFALEKNLRGSKDYRNLEGLSEEMQEILEALFELEKALKKGKTFEKKLDALENYLDRKDIYRKLEHQMEEREAASDWVKASKYRQVGEKIKAYLQEMREFMLQGLEESDSSESERISTEDFAALILTGLEALEYAAAPPVPDQIVVGSLEHTRLATVKIVFAIGLTENNVPSVQEDSGFFSDWERQSIKGFSDGGFGLAEDRKNSIFKAQLTIFMSLMSATEKLYLSYALTDTTGKSERPSALFYQIRRMFPKNEVKNLAHWWLAHEKITYPKPTLVSFLKQFHLGGENTLFYPIYQKLKDSQEHKALERLTQTSFSQTGNLPAGLAEKLYHKQRKMSVSRLESFSSCPFLHFLRYGIKAREIVPYQAERMDMGLFLHKVLETVFHLSQKLDKQVYELTEEEYQEVMQEAVQKALQENKRNIFTGNARNRFLADRLAEIANRVVRTSQKQMQLGAMKFYQEELFFRKEDLANIHFYTEDGQEFFLEGVIDRMDIQKEGASIYFSILDYKTGEHDLDYTKIFYGLQLQLMIYLKAGEEYLLKREGAEKVLPISGAYFHMKNPLFAQSDLTGGYPEEEDFLKAMRLKGVFVAENLAKLDKSLESGGQSQVMNIRLKKDGTPYAGAMVLSEEELEKCKQYSHKKAEELATRIWQGDTEVRPFYYNKQKPCTYCPYVGICKVDLKENPYRYLTKKQKEDIVK
ncbi:MAG: PD-(D/E)XK nuclease family protein [Eubacteriales bacterium]|nr:PD-(D/E)XK nuclease family protein [Eubacteriales bacterium]